MTTTDQSAVFDLMQMAARPFEEAVAMPPSVYTSDELQRETLTELRPYVLMAEGHELAAKPASGMTYDGQALVTRPLQSGNEASRVVLAYRRGARLSIPAEEFAWLCRNFFGIDLD